MCAPFALSRGRWRRSSTSPYVARLSFLRWRPRTARRGTHCAAVFDVRRKRLARRTTSAPSPSHNPVSFVEAPHFPTTCRWTTASRRVLCPRELCLCRPCLHRPHHRRLPPRHRRRCCCLPLGRLGCLSSGVAGASRARGEVRPPPRTCAAPPAYAASPCPRELQHALLPRLCVCPSS